MKKGLRKRRAFAFLVAAAMVIPQGVYAAETGENEASENAITEEVLERVHEEGCILAPDHEGNCVTTPTENVEETQPEKVHVEGCILAPDHEGDCVTEQESVHEDGCTLAPDHEGDCVTAPAEKTEDEQPEREHEDGCILPSDHEGECEVEEQEEAMLLKAPKAGKVLTIDAQGGEGVYTSLADAVAAAEDGDTIELQSDLISTKYAIINAKDITINGNGHTIARGEGFIPQNDRRGGYHPAMIEVANGAKLTLIDITLDDDLKTEGAEYLEQLNGKPNENKVQDAIIAAYRDGGTIVLGDKVTLKNFGGISAVRIGGPGQGGDGTSTLIMQTGSKIIDDTIGSRKGGVAAVWSQGGKIEMQEGSEISGIDGRAIFLEDGGIATVCGSITDITANSVMTYDPEKGSSLGGGALGGFGGIAVAARGNSTFTLGKNGIITRIVSDESKAGDVAVMLEGSTFATEKDSMVCDIDVIGLVDNNGGKIEIGGSVTRCDSGNILFRLRGGGEIPFKLLEGGNITQCTTTDVAAIYLNGGKPNIEISGTIDGFNKTALWISNNGPKPDGEVTVTKTGVITNITGIGIRAQDQSTVTIAGEITNCSDYAVVYEPKATQSLLKIESTATIQKNNEGEAQIKILKEAESLSATNAQRHVEFAPGGLDGNKTIDLYVKSLIELPAYNVTLDDNYKDIKLGNASSSAVDAIKDSIEAKDANWTVVGSNALWFQTETDSYHFKLNPSIFAKPDEHSLYAAIIPLEENGTPAASDVTLVPVDNEPVVDVTLTGPTPGTSYALMLVNSDEYSISPADITIYTGGDEDYTNNGLPEDYVIEGLPEGYNDIEGLKEKLGGIQYLDANGDPIVNDKKPGEYRIAFNNPLPDDYKINGNDVEVVEGKLIIRYTADQDESISGTNVNELLNVAPTMPVKDYAIGVVESGSIYYINNDTSRKITDISGISLLDDDLLTSGNDGRQELMEKRANEMIQWDKEIDGLTNQFSFHYLDLVDRNNGDAWVSSTKPITVYLPYPKDTDQDTEFKLLHYKDLHREYGITEPADVKAAIEACEIEDLSGKIQKTEIGIAFSVDQSGFSPFALVWQGEKSEGGGDGSSSSGGSHTSNTYYVRYHNDDETEKDGKFIPGETVTVKGNVFTSPVGKVLAGWSLEEDGKVDYKVGDTFRMPGSSVDLYAVWKDAETESHSAYISGYPDGTVGPDKTITRAEAATMFYNLLADKTGDAKTFTDVPANQWYAKAVMTLAGKGVISGYPDGTFKPDASITRAEFVTMAMNFANAEKGTACSFPDVPQNMWYYGAIAGATQNGWISGYPDGTFGPDRYITRAEVTSVINRMENRAADMSFMMDHLDELRTFSDLSFGHWAYGSMMEAANGHDYTRADPNSYESWVDIH